MEVFTWKSLLITYLTSDQSKEKKSVEENEKSILDMDNEERMNYQSWTLRYDPLRAMRYIFQLNQDVRIGVKIFKCKNFQKNFWGGDVVEWQQFLSHVDLYNLLTFRFT